MTRRNETSAIGPQITEPVEANFAEIAGKELAS
jgi:hypothetical protein